MKGQLLLDPRPAFDHSIPQRVVSLIPSITSSVLDLGLGESLVGVTDYCVDAAGRLEGLARVGGPLTVQVLEVLRLRPDLVIANREENHQESVEALAEAGRTVWLTFPTTVRQAIEDLRVIANLFRSDLALEKVNLLEKGMEWAEAAAADQAPVRYFCPVWQKDMVTGERWWMTFNNQTYPADVLRIFGGENVFGTRQRHYPLSADLENEEGEDPGERDTRYPRVKIAEIIAAQPDLILLPSEPYAYSEKSVGEFTEIFAKTPAGRDRHIYLIDGTLITWFGTRLAQALEELPNFFSRFSR